MSQPRAALLLLFGLGLSLVAGCAPSDPVQRVLEERSRWHVTLLSWTQQETGEIDASLRVSGPRKTTLPTLTFKLLLMDAGDEPVDHEWHSIDLAQIEGGGPEDVFVRLPSRAFEVQGLGIDLVRHPAESELARISEVPR